VEVKRIVPNLASADPKASREFYASFLGLRIGMDMGWITTFVSTSHPSAQVSICPGETERTGCSSLSIEVDDVDAAFVEPMPFDDVTPRPFAVADHDAGAAKRAPFGGDVPLVGERLLRAARR